MCVRGDAWLGMLLGMLGTKGVILQRALVPPRYAGRRYEGRCSVMIPISSSPRHRSCRHPWIMVLHTTSHWLAWLLGCLAAWLRCCCVAVIPAGSYSFYKNHVIPSAEP